MWHSQYMPICLLTRLGRMARVAEMLVMVDEVRRGLDKEGELWLLLFKANHCVTPPVERARMSAMAYPCEYAQHLGRLWHQGARRAGLPSLGAPCKLHTQARVTLG